MIGANGTPIFPDRIGIPTVGEIAQGLGRAPRFAGQTRTLYPVLAHSLVVANLVYKATGDNLAALCGLLHDAPEAFLGDTPSTWKVDAHEAAERKILRRCLARFGITLAEYDDHHWQVKAADMLALRAEAHLLGHAAAEEYWPGAGTDTEHAEARLLTRYQLAKVDTWTRRCDTYRRPATAEHELRVALVRYGAAIPEDHTVSGLAKLFGEPSAFTFGPATISFPGDTDVSRISRFSVRRIARTFRIPPAWVGDPVPACSAVRVSTEANAARRAAEARTASKARWDERAAMEAALRGRRGPLYTQPGEPGYRP